MARTLATVCWSGVNAAGGCTVVLSSLHPRMKSGSRAQRARLASIRKPPRIPESRSRRHSETDNLVEHVAASDHVISGHSTGLDGLICNCALAGRDANRRNVMFVRVRIQKVGSIVPGERGVDVHDRLAGGRGFYVEVVRIM